MSGYAYHNLTGTVRDMDRDGNQVRNFVIVVDQSERTNVEPELSDQGGMFITTYDDNNDEFAIYCKNSSKDSNITRRGIAGANYQISGPNCRETSPNDPRTSFAVKAASGDIYSSGTAVVREGITVGSPDMLQAANIPNSPLLEAQQPYALSGPHVAVIGTHPRFLLHAQPDSNNSGEDIAPSIVMSNPDNDDLYGPTGGSGSAAFTVISNRDGSVLEIERSSITLPKLESAAGMSANSAIAKGVWGIKATTDGGTPTQGFVNEKTYVRWGDNQRNTDGNVISEKSLENFPRGNGAPPAWLEVGGIWIDTSDAASSDSNSFALRIKTGTVINEDPTAF